MESRRKPFPAKAVFGTAAALALCIGLFAGLASRASRCTPEQFKKAALPIEGQAYVTLYVKNSRVNLQSGKSHPTWGYSLYLREDHGVGFQIESLRIVYFLDNGQTVGTDYSASDIARMKQTSHLNGYGLIVLAPGYTPSDQSPAHPTGAGILLEGRDDGGRRLTFTHYIPLDPYALKGLNPQDNLTGNVTLSMHNLGIYTPESGLFIPSEYKDVTTYVLGWYKAGKLIAIELLNESVSFNDTWPRLHRRQPEPVRTQLGRRSRAGYFFPPADGRQQPRAAAFVAAVAASLSISLRLLRKRAA